MRLKLLRHLILLIAIFIPLMTSRVLAAHAPVLFNEVGAGKPATLQIYNPHLQVLNKIKQDKLAKQKALEKRRAIALAKEKARLKRIATEKARLRKLAAIKAAQQAKAVRTPVNRSQTVGYNSSGNSYSFGFCTYYVKNKKPSIPNGWHNAYQWLGYARASGWATGSTPRAGAVGTSGNHVVYIERVSGSRVYLSAMNEIGWNKINYRWASASSFVYIY